MKLRLIIAHIGNIIDIIATLHLTEQGFYEANPFMRPLLDCPWLFATVKLLAITLVCLFLWKRKEDRHALPLATFAAVVYGLIAVYYMIWMITM
jgi:hypothetical protein